MLPTVKSQDSRSLLCRSNQNLNRRYCTLFRGSRSSSSSSSGNRLSRRRSRRLILPPQQAERPQLQQPQLEEQGSETYASQLSAAIAASLADAPPEPQAASQPVTRQVNRAIDNRPACAHGLLPGPPEQPAVPFLGSVHPAGRAGRRQRRRRGAAVCSSHSMAGAQTPSVLLSPLSFR